MITEDYVSFETAKLLKEKGFDEEIETLIRDDGKIYYLDENSTSKKHHEKIKNTTINPYSNDCSCPTLQMAMKWLREEHNTIIIIIPSVLQSDNLKWIASIKTFNKEEYYLEEQGIVGKYNTYEEAAENAIKCCLENLI